MGVNNSMGNRKQNHPTSIYYSNDLLANRLNICNNKHHIYQKASGLLIAQLMEHRP